MGSSAAGLFLFTYIDPDAHLGFIITGLMLLCFGSEPFFTPNTNAVMSSIEKRLYSDGSATLGAMRLIDQMLGMGIMLLFGFSIGNALITPEFYPFFLTSMRTAFILFAILCVGGILASQREGKVR